MCRDSLGDHGPPTPDLEVFLDAAALPTRRVLQASDSGDGWLFAKVGLYVRPHLTVELAVEPPVEGAIDYGPGDRTERIVLSPCTRTPGRWLVYPGGYYVRKPACLTIRVRAGGGEAVARVPVGEACKGE